MCKSDEDIEILRKWLTSAVESGIADKGTIRVLTGINERHPHQQTKDDKQFRMLALWWQEDNGDDLTPADYAELNQLEQELNAPVTKQPIN